MEAVSLKSGQWAGGQDGTSDAFSRLFLQFAVTFLLFISTTYALYEDQIGKFDWRQQYLGRVRMSYLDWRTTGSVPGLVFVTTDQNVLASVGLKTGELFWRQVLEDVGSEEATPHQDQMLVAPKSENLIAITGRGRMLRCIDKNMGTIKWEEMLCETASSHTDLKLLDSNTVLVLSCSRVFAFDIKKGRSLWNSVLNPENRDSTADWLGLKVQQDGILAVGGVPHSKLIARQLNPNNGAVKSQIEHSVPWFNTQKCTFGGASMACVSGSDLNIAVLSSVEWRAVVPVPLHSLDSDISAPDTDQPYFFLTSDSGSTLYKVKEGTFEVSEAFHSPKRSILAFAKTESESLAVMASSDGEIQTLATFSLAQKKFLDERKVQIPLTDEISPFDLIIPIPSPKSSDWRFLTVSRDDSLALFKADGRSIWRRPEALASILSVEMVDLPLSETQASIEKEFSIEHESVVGMFIQRLKTQAEHFRALCLKLGDRVLATAGVLDETWLDSALGLAKVIRARKQSSLLMAKGFERDDFGLHKVIVVATQTGKLFGLDNIKGGVIWERWVEELMGMGSRESPQLLLPLFLQRTTAHYPHPAQCAVIGKHRKTGGGLVVSFDPMNGKLVERWSVPFVISHASLLPYTNPHEVHGLLLASSSQDQTVIYPEDTVVPKDPPIFLMRADPRSGVLTGFKLQQLPSTGRHSLVPVWQTELAITDTQTLIRITPKRSSEKVHCPGRALGDRSVLYKYINPNLIAVAALETGGKPGGVQSALGGGGLLSIFLVDAVSGQVIHSVHHQRVTGPVHLVHTENWILYSYWSEKGRRTELGVMELYEGKSQTDPEEFSSLVPTRTPPLVLRQGYIFPQGVTATGVTDTERGLTNRHVLLAMPFGGILEVPKSLLDPRRSLTPTMEEREEGLMPYMPELPIPTDHIVNYNQSCVCVRGIHSAPSALESTSLVFVYGLDLFFTRLTPSGTFDILKDDFDHLFISLVLVGLLLGAVVSKKIARRRDLKQAWK